MATHPSVPAWGIPWTEEPGGPPVHGTAESDMTERACTRARAHTHTHTHTFAITPRMYHIKGEH